jgi:hypothetical protein
MIADQIAELFGNDGMNFILRGEYLSETKDLDEVCLEHGAKKERARVWYDENGQMNPDYDPSGDIIRYEFKDGSAIVVILTYR